MRPIIAIALLLATPALSQTDTTNPHGGRIDAFVAAVDELNAHHQSYRIDDVRESAATLFLTVDRVCITPGAQLGFHAATHDYGYGAQVLWEGKIARAFPRLYQYVASRGWFGTPAIHYLSGAAAIRLGVPACGER